jgi:8-oxo-dGTP pyrophosphatase MutT (NUDIX family)
MSTKPRRLRWYSEVADSHPDYRADWRYASRDVPLAHERYGAIWHAVVCSPDGTPLYDQPLWTEPPGAIIVATDEVGRIGFVRNFRVAVREAHAPLALPPRNFDGYGRVSLELPRGFPEPGESIAATAKREAEEELGIQAGEPVLIGWHNSNTTYFPSSIPIFLLPLAGPARAPATADPNEPIEGTCFLTVAEALECVRQGDVLCGMTKSALLTYLSTRPANAEVAGGEP